MKIYICIDGELPREFEVSDDIPLEIGGTIDIGGAFVVNTYEILDIQNNKSGKQLQVTRL